MLSLVITRASAALEEVLVSASCCSLAPGEHCGVGLVSADTQTAAFGQQQGMMGKGL